MKKLFNFVPVPRYARRAAFAICLSVIFLAVFAVSSYAQEAGELDALLGLEANNNSPKGAAGGASLALQFSFLDWLSAGLKQEVSYNFNDVLTSETSATLRWTFLRPAGIALFVEGFAGLSSMKELNARLAFRPLGGGGVGARFNIGNFYIEPQASYGWPRLWGAGVNFGYGFHLPKIKKQKASPESTENTENTDNEGIAPAPETVAPANEEQTE